MSDEALSSSHARAKTGIAKLGVSTAAIFIGGLAAFIPGTRAKVMSAWLVAAGLVGVISFVLVDAPYFKGRRTLRDLAREPVKQHMP